MKRIFLADDHAIVRGGLARLINDAFDMEIVGETDRGMEALRLARSEAWDAIVLDISLPDCNGIDVLKQLQEFRPDLPVLILSMYPEDQYAVRALRAGAMGYMTKSSAPDQLIQALRMITEGRRFITPEVAERLLLDRDLEDEPHGNLSDREFQVFIQIARGSKPGEIARSLKLSLSTVNTYRRRVLEKLGVDSNAEIIQYAFRHNLVD